MNWKKLVSKSILILFVIGFLFGNWYTVHWLGSSKSERGFPFSYYEVSNCPVVPEPNCTPETTFSIIYFLLNAVCWYVFAAVIVLGVRAIKKPKA